MTTNAQIQDAQAAMTKSQKGSGPHGSFQRRDLQPFYCIVPPEKRCPTGANQSISLVIRPPVTDDIRHTPQDSNIHSTV